MITPSHAVEKREHTASLGLRVAIIPTGVGGEIAMRLPLIAKLLTKAWDEI